MNFVIVPVALILAVGHADDYYYNPPNYTRPSLSGIQEYRSALTLDWIDAEDKRQRELVAAFETEASPPARVIRTECIGYARPASGKVARLMLELLKNLEGDEGTIVSELIQALIRNKLLVETSMLDAEPDLDALVKTPDMMMGEPHTTFPRILAVAWMSITDPVATKKSGWCPIKKVTKYLGLTKPVHVAKHMRALDPVLARARFIMEEFIQHVTPLNIYPKKQHKGSKIKLNRGKNYKTERTPPQLSETQSQQRMHLVLAQSRTTPAFGPGPDVIDGSDVIIPATSRHPQTRNTLYACSVVFCYCLL